MQALYAATNGQINTAVGQAALMSLSTGNDNIALGYLAGNNLTTGSSNIDIGNFGLAGESGVIRIGIEGSQSNAYVAGIYETVLPTNGLPVFVDQYGQLGTTNTIPLSFLPPIPTNDLPYGGLYTINTGPGIGGGGALYPGGSVTVSNTGVIQVLGSGDGQITVPATNGGDCVLYLNDDTDSTPDTIVARGDDGSISAAALYLDFPAAIYAGGNGFILEQGSLYMGFMDSTYAINPVGDTLCNTGFGDYALDYEATETSSTGAYNTAIGEMALRANEIGSFNTASGFMALYTNQTGSNNTGIGYQALASNTFGLNNTAIGSQSLFLNSDGSNNTASGVMALYNSTGTANTADGYQALYNNQNGIGNTASGLLSLYSNTSGGGNTAVGLQALLRRHERPD